MPNSYEFINFVLRCWNSGMNTRSISQSDEAKKLYAMNSSRELTKNVIIGLINRNRNAVTKVVVSKKSFQTLAKDIRKEQLKLKLIAENKKFRERSCLSCREKSIMEKNIYICTNCKSNHDRYGNTDSYSVHINI